MLEKEEERLYFSQEILVLGIELMGHHSSAYHRRIFRPSQRKGVGGFVDVCIGSELGIAKNNVMLLPTTAHPRAKRFVLF